MGTQDIKNQRDSEQQRDYMKALLEDLRALEQMLNDGLVESDMNRIGAEQEIVLVDRAWRPHCKAMDILPQLNDGHFTNELGQFNLEYNVDPLHFSGNCLLLLESQLNDFLHKLRQIAAQFETDVVLTGILPTFSKSDLTLRNLTPKPRYYELDNALKRLRGGEPIRFEIRGLDELAIEHESVMLEACNTSFQVHFQVPPSDFARYYNIAQAVAAPVLAAAVNSPLMFGKRLWKETRIAVFQEAIDTRSHETYPRNLRPRVSFGSRWIESTVLEIFQEDISQFRTFFAMDVDEDASEMLKAGKVPRLKALQLFNGSVYRWMRPCYGITNGKAHLRIENRILPSGPTVVDEVANAAFWLGLVHGLADEVEDITRVMDFDDASANFYTAAHQGLESHFTWLKGKSVSARRLISDKLLPVAYKGLEKAGIDVSDANRFLGIVEKRTRTGRTGARWILESFDIVSKKGNLDEALKIVTGASNLREKSGKPVHEWSLVKLDETGDWKSSYQRVEQFMTKDVYSVGPDEPVELVASIMVWKRIRHVPIEDEQHNFLGLISYRTLVELLVKTLSDEFDSATPVRDIMIREAMTITPSSSAKKALEIMRQKKIGCLPVVKKGKLVGLVTERDFMDVARELLEQKFREK